MVRRIPSFPRIDDKTVKSPDLANIFNDFSTQMQDSVGRPVSKRTLINQRVVDGFFTVTLGQSLEPWAFEFTGKFPEFSDIQEIRLSKIEQRDGRGNFFMTDYPINLIWEKTESGVKYIIHSDVNIQGALAFVNSIFFRYRIILEGK